MVSRRWKAVKWGLMRQKWGFLAVHTMFTRNLTRLRLLLIVLLYVGFPLVAQEAVFPTLDFRSRALGRTGVTATGVEALWSNPAGLATTRSLAATATTEQRFGVRDLSIHAAGVALPGGIGLQLASFAYAGLAEQRLGVAYGRRLSDRIRLGVELIGLFTRFPGQASELRTVPGIGLSSRLSDRLDIGIHLVGIPGEKKIGPWLAVGGSYRPSDQLLITAEIQSSPEHPVQMCVGLEYRVGERFALRGGGASAPAQLSFGSAYRIAGRLEVGFTAAYHRQLGVSPLVGFTLYPGGDG